MLKNNLVEFFFGNSAETNGISFIRSHDREMFISYADLFQEVQKTASFLESQQIQKGDELIFQINDNFIFVKVFWACLLKGIIPVPLHTALNSETRFKLVNVWNSLNNPAILADSKTGESLNQKLTFTDLKGFSSARLLVSDGDFSLYSPLEITDIPQEDQIAFIQFSSGSTGTPKGVMLTHGNLLANIEAIINGAALSKADATLGWMPLTHDLGLIGFHLTPLVLGINQFILDTDAFVRRPSIWIDLIDKNRVSFTASPNFGYKHFMAHNRETSTDKWDLSCVKRILNGAEPISVEVASQFLDTLAPFGLKRESMFPVYGMAEASLAITFPEIDKPFHSIKVSRERLLIGKPIVIDKDGIDLISVGKPIMHCSVRVCDDSNIPLEDGHVGFIKISGKNVTKGYYNNPYETEKAIGETGWLNTGDLGFFHNGDLFITGRSKDIIFSNGINLFPHDLERLAEQIEGVNIGRIVFTSVFNPQKGADDILCFLVHRGNLESFVQLGKEIRHQISTRVSTDIDFIIPINAIPKTTSGKIQRYLLAERFNQGEFTELLAELNEIASKRIIIEPSTEVQHKLFTLWNEELEGEIKSIQDNFFEFGGNSLRASILCGKISKEFSVDLSLRELFKNPTIETLAEILSTKSTEEFKHIPLTSVRQFYPCSSAQKRLYILHQLEPDKTNYHIITIHRLVGEPDIDKLNTTFTELIRRHEILRTNFITPQGEPVQVIRDAFEVVVEVIELDAKEYDSKLRETIVPFNLEKGNLFRIKLFKINNTKQAYLLFDIHHIVMDGFSLNRFVIEFSKLYGGDNEDSKSISFKDYAVWENDFLATKKIKIQEEYWLNEFKELPVNLDLPTDFSRNPQNENRAKAQYIQLNKSVSTLINKRVEQQHLTHFHLFFSAFSLLLNRYSGKSDLVIGTPIINRPHIDLQHTLGTFINTLPIRVQLSPEQSAVDYLNYVKDKTMDIFTHQNYPFERLVEQLALDRDMNRNPLFDVFFVYQNANDSSLKLDDLEVKKIPFNNEYTKFDLNVHVSEVDGQFEVMLEYNSDVFKAESIEQLGKHYSRLLQEFCEHPKTALRDLNWLSPEELLYIKQVSQGVSVELSATNALEKFSKNVKENSTKTALIAGNEHWTYQELDLISNYYAEILQKQGVKPGQMTGISFSAYEKIVPAILACWKAGVPYVPIDPNNPQERNKHIISDSGLSVIFTDKSISNGLEIDIDFKQKSTKAPENTLQADSVAYVIYTSGTTGLPKGTLIKHQALVNYTDWLRNSFSIDDKQQSVLLSSYAFDLGYTTLFGTVLNGGTLHILSEENRQEAAFVLDYIAAKQITYIKTTPSQLFTFIHSTKRDLFASMNELKSIFVGGEPIKVNDLRELKKLNEKIQFINHYGPTEATIGCIAKRIDNLDTFAKQPVIGSPMQNAEVSILDANQKPAPLGVIGELCISGLGLSGGYYQQEKQTAEKFIEIDKQRIYRTGDLAKRSANGEIILLGRNDDQVKIRGYRVELLEVEKSILALEGVAEALVLRYKDHAQQDALVAYVVQKAISPPTGVEGFSAKEIKNKLKSSLPPFMVPELIMQLDSIPLTANGKLDKAKLPKPLSEPASHKQVSLSEFNAGQLKLYEIWKELLQVEVIDLHDNFFNLGGHSLKANMLVSKIHKHFEVELRLKDIFEHPTLEDLEQLIQTKEIKRFMAIAKAEKREFYPCSSAQQRMFVLHEIQPESIAYNMSGAFVVSGKIDLNRLNKAFLALIERHESLRTGFCVIEGQICQKVYDTTHFKIELIEDVRDTEQSIKNFVTPFDLAHAPLFRIGLGKMAANQDHLLIFDMHHIISDGSSMGILIQDFTAIYDNKILPELPIQYVDFAVWQDVFVNSTHYEQQQLHWMSKFNDEIPLLDLETDFTRPTELKKKGSNFIYSLNIELTKRIKAYALQNETTLFIALTSFYSLLLSKKTRQEDLIIGTPVAGRFHSDLQQLIGVFLNMLPLRIRFNMEDSFQQFLKQNHEQFVRDMENQHFPFDQLIDELNLERSLNRNPLFDTMLVVQNMDLKELKTSDLQFTPYEFDLGRAQLDLSLIVFENEGKLEFNVEYNTELFQKPRIENLMKEFETLIGKILDNDSLSLKTYDLLTDEVRNKDVQEILQNKFEIPNRTVMDDLLDVFKTKTKEIAIVDFENELTYSQFYQKTAKVQQILLQNGIKPGDVVGVHMVPDMDILPVIYGILFTGAVYLPLEMNYPEQRIQFMVKDSGCKLLISSDENTVFTVPHYNIATAFKEPFEKHELHNYAKQSDIAYIIYTSGTTGTPKGVMITHQNLYDYILTLIDVCDINEKDCVILQISISFDMSLDEIFPTLLKGGKVFVLNHQKDLNLIMDAIDTGHPTLLSTSPLVVNFLNQTGRSFGNVKQIISGGEELKAEYFTNIPENITIWNGYGPTEVTVFITMKKVDRSRTKVSLGHPIRNRHVFIVDQHQNLLPKGMMGELCVSGIGLAKGYLNSPEITNSKFVPHPYLPGEKLYRTGDLARWNTEGEIDFFGRIDKQVKIRGFRIEIGEILQTLLDLSYIDNCYIKLHVEDNDKMLIAYYTAPKIVDPELIAKDLAQHLPDYMIPSIFVHLDEMPINANGKTDEKRLPEPILAYETASDEELTSEEIIVQEVLIPLLKRDKISFNKSFFELGGDSIKAIQFVNAIRSKGFKLEVKQVFEARTLRELGLKMEKAALTINQAELNGAYQLTPIQRDFFEKAFENENYYNQSIALKTSGQLDEQRVFEAYKAILKHHDNLRTLFVKKDAKPVAMIQTFDELILTPSKVIELNNEQAVIDEMNARQQNLQLDKNLLFNYVHLRSQGQDYLFFLTHHLLVDGVSWRILLEDFIQTYELADFKIPFKTSGLPEYSVALQEYAKQSEVLQELPYWQGVIDQGQQNVFDSDSGTIVEAQSYQFEIDDTLTQELIYECNTVYNTRTEDLLLAAMSLTFQEWKNAPNILIDVEGHGRENLLASVDINRTVGWFTSIYPVLLTAYDDLSKTIIDTKDRIHKVPKRGFNYLVLKYLSEINGALNQKSEILFNYLGEINDKQIESRFEVMQLANIRQVDGNNRKIYALEINQYVQQNKLYTKISAAKSITSGELENFESIFRKNLIDIIGFCLGKETSEITQSDLSFDISMDDFDNIFGE